MKDLTRTQELAAFIACLMAFAVMLAVFIRL